MARLVSGFRRPHLIGERHLSSAERVKRIMLTSLLIFLGCLTSSRIPALWTGLSFAVGPKAFEPTFRASKLGRESADVQTDPEVRPAATLDDHYNNVDTILTAFWAARSGDYLRQSEKATISMAGMKPGMKPIIGPRGTPTNWQYGEMTFEGVRQLGCLFGIGLRQPRYRGPVHFMDLGSGMGKLVAQTYLEWPGIETATGIELAPTRARHATQAWKTMCASGAVGELRSAALALGAGSVGHSAKTATETAVQHLKGDILKSDVSKATHIFIAARCMHNDLLDSIAAKLGREATSLVTLVAINPFPNGIPGMKPAGIGNLGSARIETGWEPCEEAHIYIRENSVDSFFQPGPHDNLENDPDCSTVPDNYN